MVFLAFFKKKKKEGKDRAENSQKLLPVLVLNFGEISALQYCTGNFQIKPSTGNSYARKYQRIPRNDYQYWR